MADQLTVSAPGAAPPFPQNVASTSGSNATNSVQAPTPTGNIWFSFSIATGSSAKLNVNFNGVTYPNVSPGEYQLGGLTTPLNLDLTVNGTAKLAWLPS